MQIGVCFYPDYIEDTQWSGEIAKIKALGLSFVRVAEFSWSLIEPKEGEYNFSWLTKTMDLSHAAGLKVIVCTPTAAAPAWLAEKYPEILPKSINGLVRHSGSRRHSNFSSDLWLELSTKVVTKLAMAVGEHPALIAWQTDNEYGCYGTTFSYDEETQAKFRTYLLAKYLNIENLNKAWYAHFWAQTYQNFEQILLPNQAVTLSAPMHQLDYRYFASAEVRKYNQRQVEIIRRYSPNRPITHNFMGGFYDYDAFEVAQDLDFASWDNYPTGLTFGVRLSPAENARFQVNGHPDLSAFNHDFYRGVGRGRWSIMEHQAGPLNWAAYNPIPNPEAVRLWTFEALSHGAEFFSYFSWSQFAGGQEQMHSALCHVDGSLSSGGLAVKKLLAELPKIPKQTITPAKVALLFDCDAEYISQISPQQGQNYSFSLQAFDFYQALRRLGLNIDIVPSSADLATYKLIVVPGLPIIREDFLRKLQATTALVVFGAASGSKTEVFAIPDNLAPGRLQSLLPIKVLAVGSLRADSKMNIEYNGHTSAVSYYEHLEVEKVVQILAHFSGTTWPAIVGHKNYLYLAANFSPTALFEILKKQVAALGIEHQDLGETLRKRQFGNLSFVFNHGHTTEKLQLPPNTEFVLGGMELSPLQLSIYKTIP